MLQQYCSSSPVAFATSARISLSTSCGHPGAGMAPSEIRTRPASDFGFGSSDFAHGWLSRTNPLSSCREPILASGDDRPWPLPRFTCFTGPPARTAGPPRRRGPVGVGAHRPAGRSRLGPEQLRRFLPSRFTLDGNAIDARPLSRGRLSALPPAPSARPGGNGAGLRVDPWDALVRQIVLPGRPGLGARRILPLHFALSFTEVDTVANRRLTGYEENLFVNSRADQLIPIADLIEKTQEQDQLYDNVMFGSQTVSYPRPFLFGLQPMAKHPYAAASSACPASCACTTTPAKASRSARTRPATRSPSTWPARGCSCTCSTRPRTSASATCARAETSPRPALPAQDQPARIGPGRGRRPRPPPRRAAAARPDRPAADRGGHQGRRLGQPAGRSRHARSWARARRCAASTWPASSAARWKCAPCCCAPVRGGRDRGELLRARHLRADQRPGPQSGVASAVAQPWRFGRATFGRCGRPCRCCTVCVAGCPASCST